jgi:addiction module HigA family antidote
MPTKKLLAPIHPGEILLEEYMQPLNLSANALAKKLGVTAARINEIATGRRGISADTALRLAHCFATSAEFWMNLQQRFELETARRIIGKDINRLVEPVSRAA